MKKIAGFFKILFLTVITGGLYGAYWIVKNMGADDDSPELSEEERKARRAQMRHRPGNPQSQRVSRQSGKPGRVRMSHQPGKPQSQ